MSMTQLHLTEIEQAAEYVRISFEHLVHNPAKAVKVLKRFSLDCPELFEAVSELVLKVTEDRDERIKEAALELLLAADKPVFSSDDYALVVTDLTHRQMCLAIARNLGNDSRDRAEKAIAILDELLIAK